METADRGRASGGPELGRGAGLFEALLLYSTFWLRGLLFPAAWGVGGPASPTWHLAALAGLIPTGALILWMIVRSEGLRAFSIRLRPRPRDGGAALALLGLLLLVGFLPEMVARLLAEKSSLPAWFDNPLLAPPRGTLPPPLLLVPLLVANAFATGYVEELYFRVYLSFRLGKAGRGPVARVAVSSLVFGASHGNQGPVAAVVAGLLGLVLSFRWESRKSWHEIGAAHGLYDLTVLLLVLYS